MVIVIENDPNIDPQTNPPTQRARFVSSGTLLSSSSTIYGSDGNPSTVTGADGKTASYTYDNEGRVSTAANALNQTTLYFYYHNDNKNDPTKGFRRYDIVLDPFLNPTTTDYDYLGRVTTVTYPDNTTTQTVYGYNGGVVTGYGVSGQTQIWGNQVVKIDQRTIATSYFYDLDGRLTDIWQPQVPDALNNNTPTSPHWAYGYDVNGNLSTITDPKLHQTTLTYDPLGRQTGRTMPGGEQESQSFDTYGRPWVHTDFDGNTATDTYFLNSNAQLAGILQQVQYVGASGSNKPTETVVYGYDSLERKITSTDTIGSAVITTTYGYDESGGYQFNGSGLSGDVDGLLTSVTTAIQGGSTLEIHYVYDAPTQRLIETWTGTGSISAATTDTLDGYDALGRLESVSVQKQNGATPTQTSSNGTRYSANGGTINTALPTTVYNYDADSRPLSVLYPNGTETDYDWSNYWSTTSRTEVVTNKRGGTTLSTFTYTFDPARRKVSETETVLNVGETSSLTSSFTWLYDDLSRLTSESFSDGVTADAYKATYSYDLAGNRYQKKSYLGANANGSTPDHTYTDTYNPNGDDQLTQEVDTLSNNSVNTTTNWVYDNNGSQTSKVVKNSGNTIIENDSYTYGARNRMTNATVAGAASSDTYNDDGDRIAETAGATASTYLVDANNPTGYSQVLEQWQGGANPAVTYTLGSAVLGQNSGGVVSYLMPDGHGSTRQLTAYTSDSTNGHVTGRYDFDAFGNQLPLSGLPANTASTVILYTGQQVDSSLGQYYLRARYYDPEAGRFSSVDSTHGDTASPQSLNGYLYAYSDPVGVVDPSGHDGLGSLIVAAGITFLLGSLFDYNYANAPTVGGPIYHAHPFAGTDAIEAALLGGGLSRLSSFFRPFFEELGALKPVGNGLAGRISATAIAEAEDAAQFNQLAETGDSLPSMTFRGDSRSPDEIFASGFKPRGSNADVAEHTFDPSGSNYVSTSRSFQTGIGFANQTGSGGWVYFVRPSSGVNVNGALGFGQMFAEELEIAVPGGVPTQDVIGAMRVSASGTLTGDVVFNPKFQP